MISGIPTVTGTFNVTLTATDSSSPADTGSQPYTIVVSGSLLLAPASLPAAQINVPYSQTISANGGTTPYTYAVTSGVLPPGLVLDPSTGIISGIPTVTNTYIFTITATDSSSPAETGSQTYTIVVSGTLVLSPASLSAAQLGVAYTETIVASNGTAPYTYAVTSGALPPGLSLNASTGVISGIPTVTSTYNFTITATDSSTPANAGLKAYTIVVSGSLILSPTSLPLGQLNMPYGPQTIVASGGTAPYTYAITAGALPPGLSLNTSTGVISGTPTVTSTYNFTITATDSNSPANTGSQAYAIVISGSLPILPTSLPDGALSTVYGPVTISASGGVAPLTYTVSVGSLPPGLTLNPSTGVISGTPTVANTYNFTITVTDSGSPMSTGSRAYTIVIAPWAYVVSFNTGTVSACSVNANGSLAPCSSSTPVGTFAGPLALAINPQHTYIYVTNNPARLASYCNIAADGSVGTCNSVSTGDTHAPAGITINASGSVAYIANEDGNTVSYCPIVSGALGTCTPQSDPLFDYPIAVTVDSMNRWIFVLNFNSGKVAVCPIQPGGSLAACTALSPATPFAGPLGIALNSDSSLAFITSNDAGGSISVCTISQVDGSLSSCSTFSSMTFSTPRGIAINATNTKAYVANEANETSQISICDLNPLTGAVTGCALDTTNTFDKPEGVALS